MTPLYLMALGVALVLFVYLLIALIYPEDFS